MGVLFPKKCVGCGKIGKYVCVKCDVGLWEEEQICPACRRLSRYGLRHKYCRGNIAGLTCLWAYEGIARKLITRAKYNFYFDYLGELVTDLPVRIREMPEMTYFWEFMETKPTVVPVPLWPKRERERGFNQSKIISLSLSRLWKLEEKNLLVRIRDTGRQVGRGREERLQNIANAFALNSKSQITSSKTILLVDDVWTTGATMGECAKVLKQAGVKRIWGLVLAR